MRFWLWQVIMPAREVLLADWLSEAERLQGEGFGSLTVVDGAAGLRLWLRTAAGTELQAELSETSAPSLASVWPAAVTAERRLAEQFGIAIGAANAGTGWLRKRVALAARNDVVWPGFKDPSDQKGSPSRRRSLPLGVLADRAAIDAGEVELR